MIRLFNFALISGLLAVSPWALAQDDQDFGSTEFGDYVVHYNALNSELIPPQTAQAYGVQRSSSRGLLTITLLDKSSDEQGTPAHAGVTSSAKNLTGQRRNIAMREISDPDGGIYYIGEFPVYHLENLDFTVTLAIEGEADPLVVEFRKQFYTQ